MKNRMATHIYPTNTYTRQPSTSDSSSRLEVINVRRDERDSSTLFFGEDDEAEEAVKGRILMFLKRKLFSSCLKDSFFVIKSHSVHFLQRIHIEYFSLVISMIRRGDLWLSPHVSLALMWMHSLPPLIIKLLFLERETRISRETLLLSQCLLFWLTLHCVMQ